MPHTFFENNRYITLVNTDVGDNSEFVCELSYAPETTQLDLVFDPSEDYYKELTEKLDSGEWEHFIARVQIKYNDIVMAETHLGSVVAADASAWFDEDADGQVDQMIKESVAAAEVECRKLLMILLEDFAN